MGRSGLEQAKRAWASAYAGLSQEQIDQRVLGFATLVEGIAHAGSVSPEQFASKLGIEAPQAKELFASLAAVGVQIDEQGNVAGAALTAQETVHRVKVAGKKFYAWCALDTLFIPGLLGQDAEVESVCPVTGEAIRLRVTPKGVQSLDPRDAVITVVLPGDGPTSTGPASPT